jgi:O-antigen ligase
MIVLAVIITIGSKSSTSLLIIILLGGIGLITYIDSLFTSIRIGKTFSIISFITLFSLIIGLMVFNPDIGNLLPELFGKDASFSGRTDLWELLIDMGNERPFLGAGYGAFWIPESERISAVYDLFEWLPGQSHNGYLDIFLVLGYAGLGTLLLLFINYFINLTKINKPHPWVLFITATIIANFQESSLLRTGHQVNFFFMFAYLLAFVDKFKKFSWSTEKSENQNNGTTAVRTNVNRFKRVS